MKETKLLMMILGLITLLTFVNGCGDTVTSLPGPEINQNDMGRGGLSVELNIKVFQNGTGIGDVPTHVSVFLYEHSAIFTTTSGSTTSNKFGSFEQIFTVPSNPEWGNYDTDDFKVEVRGDWSGAEGLALGAWWRVFHNQDPYIPVYSHLKTLSPGSGTYFNSENTTNISPSNQYKLQLKVELSGEDE